MDARRPHRISPFRSDSGNHLGWHNGRVHNSRHDTVDQNIFLLLQQRGDASYEMIHCSLSAAVYRIRLVGKDRANTTRDDNTTTRLRVMAHEMDCQLGAIDNPLVIDVHDGQVWCRRDVVNAVVLRAVDVEGRRIDNTGIRT